MSCQLKKFSLQSENFSLVESTENSYETMEKSEATKWYILDLYCDIAFHFWIFFHRPNEKINLRGLFSK